jgi:hypothetical protein
MTQFQVETPTHSGLERNSTSKQSRRSGKGAMEAL